MWSNPKAKLRYAHFGINHDVLLSISSVCGLLLVTVMWYVATIEVQFPICARSRMLNIIIIMIDK